MSVELIQSGFDDQYDFILSLPCKQVHQRQKSETDCSLIYHAECLIINSTLFV